MASCERCWSDAFLRARVRGIPQADAYEELLAQRMENPCTPRQQAGQWWDEERQIDRRNLSSNRESPNE